MVKFDLAEQINDIAHSPELASDASRHCGRASQRLVNLGKVVIHEMQRDCGNVVIKLLRESIGEPSKAAHVHAHGEVLTLNIAGADMLWIRNSEHWYASGADALCGAVARFLIVAGKLAVNLHENCIVDVACKNPGTRTRGQTLDCVYLDAV